LSKVGAQDDFEDFEEEEPIYTLADLAKKISKKD